MSTKGKLIALRPFVVTADVVVELRLITMTCTLCFGPFNRREDADEWRAAFEQEHLQVKAKEGLEGIYADWQSRSLPQPYLTASLRGVDVIQAGAEAREKGALIPPSNPVVTAHQIHVCALRAFQEAITAAFHFLDGGDECA